MDTQLDYPSVVEEYSGSALAARYDYGDDLVRMDRGSASPVPSYYLFDGLGSTRQLTSSAGAVTDTDAYDAFGNLLAQTGSTVNPYLFDGQEQDAGTGLYYLRARYMNPMDGRFLSQDPFAGNDDDPISLHRYLYADNGPVDLSDPSGNYTDDEGRSVERSVEPQYLATHPGRIKRVNVTFGKRQYFDNNGWRGFVRKPLSRGLAYLKPDIFDWLSYTFAEIKPLSVNGITDGFAQLDECLLAFGPKVPHYAGANPLGTFVPDIFWEPSSPIVADNGNTYYLENIGGIIFYSSIPSEGQALEVIAVLGLGRNALQTLLRITATQGTGAALRQAGGAIGEGVAAENAKEEQEAGLGTVGSLLPSPVF